MQKGGLPWGWGARGWGGGGHRGGGFCSFITSAPYFSELQVPCRSRCRQQKTLTQHDTTDPSHPHTQPPSPAAGGLLRGPSDAACTAPSLSLASAAFRTILRALCSG